MDSLTTTAAYIGVIGSIAKLILQIVSFVFEIKGAKEDLENVIKELEPLDTSFRKLRDESTMANYPEDFRRDLQQILEK
jgi:hypothetical protein